MRLLRTQDEHRDVVARPALAELEHVALDPRGDLGGVEAAATPQQVHEALFPEQASLRARFGHPIRVHHERLTRLQLDRLVHQLRIPHEPDERARTADGAYRAVAPEQEWQRVTTHSERHADP